MAGARILVVDGDACFRCAIVRRLSEERYECIAAGTGAQAIAMALQRRPDLIVLDLRLPDMMGFSLAHRLQQDGRTARIPVIMVTSEQKAGDLLTDAAASVQAKALLRRPFKPEELVREIKSALMQREGVEASDLWTIARGPLQIDLKKRVVVVGGKTLRLGPRRFEALCALARSKDGVPTRILGALVWGGEDGPLNTTAKTINRLRHDLQQACGQDLIVAIPGGYRLQ